MTWLLWWRDCTKSIRKGNWTNKLWSCNLWQVSGIQKRLSLVHQYSCLASRQQTSILVWYLTKFVFLTGNKNNGLLEPEPLSGASGRNSLDLEEGRENTDIAKAVQELPVIGRHVLPEQKVETPSNLWLLDGKKKKNKKKYSRFGQRIYFIKSCIY